ncbi:MAG TPA: calcium/proton exchanger [Solirubrobacterales bacterium]|nr:calcium/proton exchanger [Solirubrobacterales bacterium]
MPQSPSGSPRRRRLIGADSWPYLLSPLIPAAVLVDLLDASAVVVFFVSAVALVPPAAMMGRATEELAERSGNVIGGLLNVTFGNAPELIIALFALEKGLHEVVKASLIGSILGNILLVMGAAMLVGGLSGHRTHGVQKFGQTAASVQSTMLLLASAALIMPGVFALVQGVSLPLPGDERVHYGSDLEQLSFAVACVLILSYAAGLLFSLRTHAALFNPHEEESHTEGRGSWSTRRSVLALAISGALVGVLSEILVSSIEETSHSIGLSEFFIGAIVVAIVGNAAEHWVAVLVAYKNKMSLAVNIAIGSSAQVALFVAPVLVLVSFVLGPAPMPLVFNGLELAGLAIAAIIANQVTQEGESTWYEGLQLLLVYLVLALAFGYA